MERRWLLVGSPIAAFCGVALVSAAIALAEPPKGGYAPDPPGHASKNHWVFEVASHDGKVSVDRVRAIAYAKPTETPRVMGRFAIELYVGKELLDRVRFNAPLMGAEPPIGNRNNFPKPHFEENATSRFEARLADHPRASYLLVVDRESGATQKFFWPPEPDGRLLPWRNTTSDAASGDFPDGGVRAMGIRDGGALVDAGGGGAAQ